MSDGFIVFIRHEDKLLLLKRGEEVTDFGNCWDGVYGVGDHNDLDHVFKRIEDSTGIQSSSLTFVRMGDARGIEFGNRLNEVTPILFVSDSSEIEPRTLYDEAMWVDPGYLNVLSPDEMDNSDDDISAIQNRPTVSQLGDMYGDVSSFLYMLKTTIGQEQKIANEIHARISGTGSLRDVQGEVFAVIHPRLMRGYIFVEASAKHHVEKLIGRAGGVTTPMRGCSKVLPGEAPLGVVSNYLEPKSATAGIEVGSVVEIRVGHFKGNRARVTGVEEGKEEVTVELFEAAVPIPITMRADNVHVTERVV
uniref:Transcription elongation factor Spt5 n=2 Tax=environmental samples TaxID=68359 RepID=A0A075HHI7_9EURY|nr:transcription antitermination protein (nusG) [uncultured marine group II/III euryarchaeote KM3_67_F03]AIF14767.1 transcription antitermination protein (nusG) [uncultured marine group II/III euryarchaeote KM3_67_H09]